MQAPIQHKPWLAALGLRTREQYQDFLQWAAQPYWEWDRELLEWVMFSPAEGLFMFKDGRRTSSEQTKTMIRSKFGSKSLGNDSEANIAAADAEAEEHWKYKQEGGGEEDHEAYEEDEGDEEEESQMTRIEEDGYSGRSKPLYLNVIWVTKSKANKKKIKELQMEADSRSEKQNRDQMQRLAQDLVDQRQDKKSQRTQSQRTRRQL